MSNQFTWNVTINDAAHKVSCVVNGNRYEIWVDDEELTIVYRSSFRKMRRGLERQIQIDGQKCLFLVWDDRPDLVVNGILQRSGKDFMKEKQRRKKNMIITCWCMFGFGLAILGFVAVSFFIIGLNREGMSWRHYSLYILAGLWIMIDSLVEMKRWKHQ